MTLAFEPFLNLDSPLARLDPRWKLAALALAGVASAVVRSVPAAALAFAGALLLAAWGRLPPGWFLARLGAAAAVLGFFVALLPLLLPGPEPTWDLGPLRLSPYGLRVAGVLSLKALAVLTLALVGLTSAPWNATLQAAHALRVPGLLLQLAALSYRYAFVLGAELTRLRIALRVRGYRNRANRHSYRTVGHVAGTLLVRGQEQAERVGQAMRCRGFTGRFRSLASFHTQAADVAFFLLVAGGATALVLWDRLPR